MGLITFGIDEGIGDPIPEGAEREYYFSQQQQNEWRETFYRNGSKEFLPYLVTLVDGRIVEYSEEKILGWSKHDLRTPHHVRFKDSVFLGTGKKVKQDDIDQVLENLVKTEKKKKPKSK